MYFGTLVNNDRLAPIQSLNCPLEKWTFADTKTETGSEIRPTNLIICHSWNLLKLQMKISKINPYSDRPHLHPSIFHLLVNKQNCKTNNVCICFNHVFICLHISISNTTQAVLWLVLFSFCRQCFSFELF